MTRWLLTVVLFAVPASAFAQSEDCGEAAAKASLRSLVITVGESSEQAKRQAALLAIDLAKEEGSYLEGIPYVPTVRPSGWISFWGANMVGNLYPKSDIPDRAIMAERIMRYWRQQLPESPVHAAAEIEGSLTSWFPGIVSEIRPYGYHAEYRTGAALVQPRYNNTIDDIVTRVNNGFPVIALYTQDDNGNPMASKWRTPVSGLVRGVYPKTNPTWIIVESVGHGVVASPIDEFEAAWSTGSATRDMTTIYPSGKQLSPYRHISEPPPETMLRYPAE